MRYTKLMMLLFTASLVFATAPVQDAKAQTGTIIKQGQKLGKHLLPKIGLGYKGFKSFAEYLKHSKKVTFKLDPSTKGGYVYVTTEIPRQAPQTVKVAFYTLKSDSGFSGQLYKFFTAAKNAGNYSAYKVYVFPILDQAGRIVGAKAQVFIGGVMLWIFTADAAGYTIVGIYDPENPEADENGYIWELLTDEELEEYLEGLVDDLEDEEEEEDEHQSGMGAY